MTEPKELAKKLYEALGKSENVIQSSNCMTRLRVQLAKKDEGLSARLKRIDGVLGVNDTDEELQIILGPGRAQKVAAEFEELIKGEAGKPKIGDGRALRDEIREKNSTPAKLFTRKIASIFLPLIPGFIACGLIAGGAECLVRLFPSLSDHPIVIFASVAGNSVFWGMNLFVGMSAAKVFGGTPILGGVLAAIMSHPALLGISLGGAPLIPGRGGVICAMLVASFGAWLEARLKRVVPEIWGFFLTPLLVISIAGAAAIFVLQPLGGAVSDIIGTTVTSLVGTGGMAAGFLLAGLWLPIVMLGLHHVMTPIHVDLISRTGVTTLLPILAMAGAGQVGASAAVYLKTKNKFLKKTIASALPAGLLGVGEPLIYGVTFPLGRPFVAACIGGAFGGALVADGAVGAATLGISGLPLAGATNDITTYLTGLAASYTAGFAAAWLMGFDDPVN